MKSVLLFCCCCCFINFALALYLRIAQVIQHHGDFSPTFPSRNCVLHLDLCSFWVNFCESYLCQDDSFSSSSSWHMNIQFSLYHLWKDYFFSQLICLCIFSKTSWLYVCGSMSCLYCVPLTCLVYLIQCPVLTTLALE